VPVLVAAARATGVDASHPGLETSTAAAVRYFAEGRTRGKIVVSRCIASERRRRVS
jgi:hypothetical protein